MNAGEILGSGISGESCSEYFIQSQRVILTARAKIDSSNFNRHGIRQTPT
jgi:hypothetical protein